ncbi:MAG: aminopeptidase, partial [Acidobacteria bacterium]|nr:aminopeptidase [Acidobacteriota bacterium]
SETIINLGSNAYHKAEVGLNILRETILGRELFDFAFHEYARRWKFKRPTPSDFFRTMEDASGVDLDWFWRGWFYTTEHTDISLDSVKLYSLDTRNPEVEKPISKARKDDEPVSLSEQRNKTLHRRIQDYPELADFYNKFDEYAVTDKDRAEYKKFMDSLEADEKAALVPGFNFYVMDFKNLGGLVMPLILKFEYTDGTSEIQRIPAEIWRRNNVAVSKLHVTRKEIKQITLDPFLETADTDLTNNSFPRKPIKSPFQLFKDKKEANPMQDLKDHAKPPTESGTGSPQ